MSKNKARKRNARLEKTSDINACDESSTGSIKQQVKTCPTCQRPFHNRKKWESRGLWPSIRYCSERCRRA